MIQELLDEYHFEGLEELIKKNTSSKGKEKVDYADSGHLIEVLENWFPGAYKTPKTFEMSQKELKDFAEFLLQRRQWRLYKNWEDVPESDFDLFEELKHTRNVKKIWDFNPGEYSPNSLKKALDGCYTEFNLSWNELDSRVYPLALKNLHNARYVVELATKSHPVENLTSKRIASLDLLRELKFTLIVEISDLVGKGRKTYSKEERGKIKETFKENNLEVIFLELMRLKNAS